MDGLEPVPIETVDEVLKKYYNAVEVQSILAQTEQYRRGTLNSLCSRGWIKTIDNKTFKTVDGRFLVP